MRWMGPVEIAGGSFQLTGPGTPYEVFVYLDSDGIPPLPGSQAVGLLTRPVVFEWCVGGRGQSAQVCEEFGSARPTTWYVMPTRDALLPGGDHRYDFGLDKVVQYARGAWSPGAIARRINAGIAAEVYYNPECDHLDPVTNHPLTVYPHGEAVCMFNAMLLKYLTETGGSSASVRYLWGGALGTRVDFYSYFVPGNWVSFRATCPRNQGAPENPHFRYHAQTSIAGSIYDPSYGSVGRVVFSEVCRPYSESASGDFHYPPVQGETRHTPIQQEESQWPPTGTPWYATIPWTCTCTP